jgi:hypothetical protein
VRIALDVEARGVRERQEEVKPCLRIFPNEQARTACFTNPDRTTQK